jgi:hypothetical protein
MAKHPPDDDLCNPNQVDEIKRRKALKQELLEKNRRPPPR